MKITAVVVALLQSGFRAKMSENNLTPAGQQEKNISDGVRFSRHSYSYAFENLPYIYTFFLLFGYKIIYTSLLIYHFPIASRKLVAYAPFGSVNESVSLFSFGENRNLKCFGKTIASRLYPL